MAHGRIERILILAKTYPSPSAKHVETSCVAGITEHGEMRRLYPVPFRMIEEGRQFKKWQWIEVRVEKASRDHRPESHKIYVDTISCQNILSTRSAWSARRIWLDKAPAFDSVDALDTARLVNGISIGLVRPKSVLSLEIVKARNADWTEKEKEKLIREQIQGDLFTEADARRMMTELRKIPFDFYYRFLWETQEDRKECTHKIVDWEAGALYWNCRRSHGEGWELPFRAKLEDNFKGKELMFLMGNQHRFQNQWMIISLIYPPKPTPVDHPQGSLF